MEYDKELMQSCAQDESSSDSDSSLQPLTKDNATDSSSSASGTCRKSRQSLYYQRKTQSREKRSYKPYNEQHYPSRQLRHYHRNRLSTQKENNSETTGCRYESDIDSELLSAEEKSLLSDDTDISDSETTETSESSSEDSFDDEMVDSNGHVENESNANEDVVLHMPCKQVPLYDGSMISRLFACVLVVSFVLQHNLSKAAWADLIRLLSVLIGKQFEEVFRSVYKMKLYLKDCFGTKDPVKVLYCSNCFIQVFDKHCSKLECQGQPLSGFLDLNLEERLKELFRDAEFCKLLKKGKENIKRTVNRTIHDIYHGLDYKNFLYPGGFLTKDFNVSLTINTDGVNKYSSSSAGHLWPVYVMINELPKEYRFNKKYIIPAYIYCDKKEPNMMTFLNPLVEKLNTLHTKGFRVEDSAAGDINVKCLLFIVSADLPARADLMNMKRFNGKCGCHLCKQEGDPYGYNNLHRSWPYKEGIALRSHDDQKDFASNATQENAVMGVKGHSVFAKLNCRFDLVRSFAVDWMHCVPLGVVKYLMNLMTCNKWKGSHFYIGTQLSSMSTRLVSIRPPENIGRLPRTLGEIKHWKATELKNWLLHFSVPILQNTLNPLCHLHWCLLSGAVGILCSDSIPSHSIPVAEEMLRDFVIMMEILYGETKCTMNVHLLTHMGYYVLRRGPLWAYSCFAFESINAFMKTFVHGTHHAMEQIACALGLTYGIPEFIQQACKDSGTPKDALSLLRKLNGQNKSSRKAIKVEGGNFLGTDILKSEGITIDNNFKTKIRVFMALNEGLKDYILQAFARFVDMNGQKIDSMAWNKTKKTDSTVIEFVDRNGEIYFGRIKFFLKAGNKGICVCHLLDIVDSESNPFLISSDKCMQSIQAQNIQMNENHSTLIGKIIQKYNGKNVVKHQTCVLPRLGKVILINIHQIIRKCVFIDISSEYWIVSRFPNIIEHN